MGDHAEIDGKTFLKFDNAIKCLSRIRCLDECGRHANNDLILPISVGYVPKCFFMKSHSTVDLPLFGKTGITHYKKCIKFTSRHVAHVDGRLEFNKDGIWGSLFKITLMEKPDEIEDHGKVWILLCNFNNSNTLYAFLVPCTTIDEHINEVLAIKSSWQEMSTRCFLPFGLKDEKAEELVSSSKSYSSLSLPSWSKQHDEQICQLVSQRSTSNIKDFIEGIKVSSGEGTKDYLFSDNVDETWSPDGDQEQFIEIKIKPGIFIEGFGLRINHMKMGYIVGPIHVMGGMPGNMEKLMERPSDPSYRYPGDEFWLLKRQKTYMKIIRVTFFLSYQGEINISGLLLIPQKSEIDCYNFFNSSALSLYPKLNNISPDILCQRAILLKRVMSVFDACLLYLYPNWNAEHYSSGIVQRIAKSLQHLLPLSEMRKALVSAMLEKSEVNSDDDLPAISINRRILESTNSGNLDYKMSIFYQIYSQAMVTLKPFHYRFPKTQKQWWICTFVNEHVSDQGGGFRDSLTNIAEELCPNVDSNKEPVFNLFITSPNQRNPEASDGDTYIPNGSCFLYSMYKWIGNLMGACFRSDENIAFSLPRFFWKLFVGHEVTWNDYSSVDQKEVTDLALMEKMDKDMFDAYFLDTRTWSHILSNGSSVELRKDGENKTLCYEDRLEYVRIARETRLNEFKSQLNAMREGFLEVVPESLMYLHTIEELEEMICGKAIVSLEDLKNHVKFRYNSENEQVKLFWSVMEKLTDEERSRFLKFASGRKRLPVKVEVELDTEAKDILPTAATCSSIFRFPKYSSFEKALAMVRYAVNSCQTIDTD